MLAHKIPAPINIENWVEENFSITLNKIEPEAVGALLFLAKTKPGQFRELMIRGLKLRLQEEVGNTRIIVQSLPVYVSECRVKVALAVTFIRCPDELPEVPLFAMSFADELDNRALRECELLAFGRASHEKRPTNLSWYGGRI